MLVTVLITFYSKEPGLLINAVQSSLGQSYENIEVLIIDDCSYLRADSELKGISDDRVRIVRNESNLGMAKSINKGLLLAKGGVVAFLDYDDIWYSSKVEKQVNCYRAEGDNKVIVYTKANIISRGTSYMKPHVGIKYDESVSDYLFCNNGLIQTSGILMNTQIAREIGMDDFRRHTDYQFCLAAEAYGCHFRFINSALYEHVIIPKLVDYNLSIKWLDTYGEFFTDKSIYSFKSRVILKLIIAHGKYKTAIKYCKVNDISMFLLFSQVSSNLIKKYFPNHIVKMITAIKNR